MNETTIQLSSQLFDGNQKALKIAIDKSISNTISWQHIESDINVLPDLKNAALILIKERLGYVPPEHVCLPIEPFLRALVHQYNNGFMTFEKLISESNSYMNHLI